jgi:hypothetical protein
LTQLALRGIPLPENEMTIMQTWLNLQDKTLLLPAARRELVWQLLMSY